MKLQIVKKGFVIREKKTRKGFSIEIGGMDAKLNSDMQKDKALVNALQRIGETLMKQLDCNGIIFNSIGFQRMWHSK